MSQTTLGKTNSNNVAGLYDEDDKPQIPIILNTIEPAGGIRSNAVDMLKYVQLQLSPKNKSLRKAILLSQTPLFQDDKHQVGFGWDIKKDYWQKDGDTFGNSCLIRFDKKKQLGIVVLSNHQDADIVNMAVDYIYAHF
jgi:CubicO group peptidase (beta-lactamase class C family)